jgi:hypothetical protein
MSVIGTAIEPHSVARIFFDCRADQPDSNDQARIERAIEHAAAMASADTAAANSRQVA